MNYRRIREQYVAAGESLTRYYQQAFQRSAGEAKGIAGYAPVFNYQGPA